MKNDNKDKAKKTLDECKTTTKKLIKEINEVPEDHKGFIGFIINIVSDICFISIKILPTIIIDRIALKVGNDKLKTASYSDALKIVSNYKRLSIVAMLQIMISNAREIYKTIKGTKGLLDNNMGISKNQFKHRINMQLGYILNCINELEKML